MGDSPPDLIQRSPSEWLGELCMNKTHSRQHTVRRSRLKDRPGDLSCSVSQGGLRYIGVWQSQEH